MNKKMDEIIKRISDEMQQYMDPEEWDLCRAVADAAYEAGSDASRYLSRRDMAEEALAKTSIERTPGTDSKIDCAIVPASFMDWLKEQAENDE